jgi:hypothetical protein
MIASRMKLAAVCVAAVLVAGCVSMPSGPRVMVLPGTGKSFDQFRIDDGQCRQYAYYQAGGQTPDQAAAQAGVGTAVIGTAVGAAAGAAFGGSQGAAIGAGTGLLFGSAVGSSNAYASSYELQGRYDSAYIQCMYALGNKVPAYGVPAQARMIENRPPPAPPANQPPPPPAGAPPAPPTR